MSTTFLTLEALTNGKINIFASTISKSIETVLLVQVVPLIVLHTQYRVFPTWGTGGVPNSQKFVYYLPPRGKIVPSRLSPTKGQFPALNENLQVMTL